jgi:hypothetical protein
MRHHSIQEVILYVEMTLRMIEILNNLTQEV